MAHAVSRQDAHGGNVHAVARETGRPLAQIVDFSASINPLGPSGRALRAAAAAMDETIHYPDPDCYALVSALSARSGLSPSQLLIGNGSSELIRLLPPALAIRRAAIVGPTFSEYARAVSTYRGAILPVHASRAEGYRPPIERVQSLLRSRARRVDALFLCNPNSPTGQSVQREAVIDLARLADQQGTWLIVDETFVDYCEQLSVLPAVERFPRLVVLRSFTKFFALPGLRIGYLAAAATVVDRVRRFQPPWSVNSLAQAAALASLADHQYVRRSLNVVQQERPRLSKALGSLPGVVVFPSVANFLLVELPSSLTATQLTKDLRRDGLLVRDCSAVPGLNQQTIRITVRMPAQNRRLLAALRRIWKERSSDSAGAE